MAAVASDRVRRRSKDRREEILAVAAELFARRGYAGVSVDDIGAQLGITGPALYRHFHGKQEVLTTILDRMMSALAAATDPADDSTGSGADAADRLRRIVSRTTTVAMDAPAAFSVWLREARHHDPATMDDFVELRRRSGELWHAAERRANPALTKAELRTREEAVVAVINALAHRPTNVTRARLEELAAAAACAAVLAPPVAETTSTGHDVDDRRLRDAPWSAPPSRRDVILGVAVPLFRTHGFAGVSMDQIGEAAGISGPSVYRYYDSKTAILVDAFDRTDSRVALSADSALSTARSATEALRLLVGAHAQVALDSADLVVVTTREALALPSEERERQAARGRAISDRWVRVLAVLRPELTEPECRLLVRAMFGVVHHLVQLAAPPTPAHLVLLAEAVAHAELSKYSSHK